MPMADGTPQKDRPCLPNISHLNAGVWLQHPITSGAHDDTVPSISP